MLAWLALTAWANEGSEVDAPVADELGESPIDPGPPIDPLLGRAFTPTRPGQVTPDDPYWDLEVLYYQERHLEGAKLAEARYAETKDPHLTLHIARFWYQELEGDETRSKSERAVIYDRLLATLDEGLAKDPKDLHLQFARGVVMARIGTSRGVLASLRLADDVEAAWTSVIDAGFMYNAIGVHEELPCDAYLALGVFYRLVPDSWLVKAIAGTKGDLQRSLEMNEKGVACAGDRIRNLKELGVTQLCLGQKTKDAALVDAGKATLNRMFAVTPTFREEVIDLRHGAKLLKDPSIACGYSRDGQQDLDESKIPR